MKQKSIFSIGFILFIATFFTAQLPTHAASQPTTLPHQASLVTAESHLEIAAIDLDVPIVTAHFTGHTWDFSHFTAEAGYFEGEPLPGQGGNVIIGAHSELDQRSPGPFYDLNKLHPGDEIVIVRAGVRYTYITTDIWNVQPTDISPLKPTQGEALTLLTCSGYNDGTYTTRLVVRAVRNHAS
jgi:sortase A